MGLLCKISLYVLFVLSATTTRGIIIQGAVPKSLWGKKVVLNGPQINVEKNFIEGPGHITSVNFLDHGKAVVSEVLLKKQMGFSVGDLFKPNFFDVFIKFIKTKIIKKTDTISSGLCSTSVQKYNGKYYALEDTSRPSTINYENGKLIDGGLSNDIPLMSPHLIDKYTNFSYTHYSPFPLKYNNTVIKWNPTNSPNFIHTGRISPCNNFLIFPLSSTCFSYIYEWLLGKRDLPLKTDCNKFIWLIYDIKKEIPYEIETDCYINIFHVPKIVESYDNKIKIYSTHVYNFFRWLSKSEDLTMDLHEHTIDLKNKKMISIRNLGLPIEFINSQDTELVGKECGDSNDILVYNILNCNTERITLPGGTIREVIPYGNCFVYYSHEKTNTYLYIVDKRTIEILTKIEVPNREPGFHTTLLD